MHKLDGVVDLKSLKKSKELQNSIEDDSRRASINSAKFRAAAQNVDYPAFAALVSCAHLKPMGRKELEPQKGDPTSEKRCTLTPPAWSFDPRGKDPTALSADRQCGTQPSKEVSSDLSLSSGKDNAEPPSSSISGSQIHDRETHLSCFKNPLFEKEESKHINHLHDQGKCSRANKALGYWVKLQSSKSALDGDEKCKNHGYENENSISDSSRATHTDCRHGGDSPAYTSDTFKKEWGKRMTQGNIECLTFLSFLSPDILPATFKVEIPPFLLAEILEALALSIPTLANERDARQKLNPQLLHEIQFDAQNCKKVVSQWVTHLDRNSKEEMEFNLASLADAVVSPKTDELKNLQNSLWLSVWIVSVLGALALCGRFGLSVKLAGHKSHCNAVRLLNFIHKNLMRQTG